MMSLLTELCPLVAGDATNMSALTGLENLCSIRVSSVAKNSNAHCPVRPPQTAIGRCLRTATNWDSAGERTRLGGRFRRRASAPENSPAIHGWVRRQPNEKVPRGTAENEVVVRKWWPSAKTFRP